MKFLSSILLILLLSAAASLYLPWWIIAVVAFAVCALIPQSAGKSFLSGFAAIFLLWGALAWLLSSNNEHILAHKISLLILKTDSPFLLILMTAVIGALVAGMAALAGSFASREKVDYAKSE